MGTHNGTGDGGTRREITHSGRRGLAVDFAPEAAPELTPAEPAAAPSELWGTGRPAFHFRGPLPNPALSPLPALRPARPAAHLPLIPETPRWSPVTVAAPLFAAVWICFAVLAAKVTSPADADIAALGDLLSIGVGIVALVLVTLSVAHTQISGLRPQPAVVAVVALGAGQGGLAWFIGSGPTDLWSVGGWLLALIGVAVPLAWVGGQFQRGVRRQRVEQHASLLASWIEEARHRAHQTVQSVHRHDVRSMLFVIEGAARTLADDRLAADQRAGFAEMLAESVQQLGALMDVRAEEIQPIAVDGIARAVVHAERKAGRTVTSALPPSLTAMGRAADVTAVLRTLVAVTGRAGGAGVHLRSEVIDGAVVLAVEPVGAEPLPLLIGNWEEIWADSFKAIRNDDEDLIDLYVAARLLAEQGADLWSTPARARFVVRLPAVSSP